MHGCFVNLQLSLITYTQVQNIMIYFEGFSICSNCIWTYLHPNFTGEMATEEKTRRNETHRTAADITQIWLKLCHTGCTHSSLQCAWQFFFIQKTLEVELRCYMYIYACSQVDFLLHALESVNQEPDIFKKKTSSRAVSEPSRCSKQYVRIFINAASAQSVLPRKPDLSYWCKEHQDWIFQAAIDVMSAGRGKTSSECW